jgi:predicted lipoprotein with Yx(FWY)xxD motif
MTTETITKPQNGKTGMTSRNSATPSELFADLVTSPKEAADATTTDLTESIIPGETATVADCKEAFEKVNGEFSILDRKQGWMGWLKGRILIRARDNACKAERMKWKDFCEQIGIPRSTASLYIRIAEQYESTEQVAGKTLTELRDAVKTRNNSTTPKSRQAVNVRTREQNLDHLPNDLETVLKVLTAAKDMTLGSTQDEEQDVAKTYNECIRVLDHIRQRATECMTEFRKRIANIRHTDLQAEKTGKTLSSREVLDPAA